MTIKKIKLRMGLLRIEFTRKSTMTYPVPHYLNGKANLPTSGKMLDIYNPATGQKLGQVGCADNNIINHAVSSAQAAFTSWSQTTPAFRSRLLFQYKALLERQVPALAALITEEHGKTRAEAESSIRRGIDVVDFACGIPSHLKGVFYESAATEVDCYSMRQPLGVCVGITPFNFPGMIPLWMFPLAVACGNTFILKPSEKDPSCPLRLVELAEEAGFPPGVINVIQGDKDTVEGLLTHPEVRAVSFVGSSPVAEQVYKSATSAGKRVQAFGGSKNHCLVMPDADLEQAAENITQAAYGCAGERCMAISVVLAVGTKTAEALVPRLKEAALKIKMGPGTDPAVQLGPLVTQAHLERVKNYIQVGIEEGADLVLDGREAQITSDPYKQGFYLGCCLFDQVTPSMRIYKEEIFGPVLVVVRVPDFEAALKLVSQHEYGNGTAIFTRDGYTARTFASRVQTGMIGINIPVPVPVAYHSFGGWKRSLFGDLHLFGLEGVQFYTKLKSVTQRWVKGESWF
jgi:malonate-semialdehyde dehydrogenase (acetylating)/methylmalonate-semialdehyde dehydrogenase